MPIADQFADSVDEPSGRPGRHRRPSRYRWFPALLLLVAWLIVGGVAGPYAGKLSQVAENDNSAFLPAAAESTRVADEQLAFSPDPFVPAVVVATRHGGVTAADRAYLSGSLEHILAVPGVAAKAPAARAGVVTSSDGRALQLVVPVATTAEPAEVVSGVRDVLADPPSGLSVYVTGPAGLIADLAAAFGGIDTTLLLVAGGAVALILVLVYRSPLLPALVLLSAVFALATASFVVYLLADHDVLALNGQSQGILSILVFGAATDYALLLVSRFREQLRHGGSRFTAMGSAWRATIAPISASAATVVLAVLCLLFSDLNSNRGLGPVAAIGIGAAWLASVTFLPAVLALCGRAAFWPRHLRADHGADAGDGRPDVWTRLAGLLDRRPRRVWLATTLALLVGAAFLPQLRADGTAQSDLFLTKVEAVTGQRIQAAHFPGGSGAPTVVLANAPKATTVREAATVPGVQSCAMTRTPDKKPVVVDGRVQILCVLDDSPASEAAIHAVERMRTAVHAVPDAEAEVGGTTAVQLDTQTISERDRALIIPIVLVVIYLVLALLLRALLAPLLLLGTVVLSFAATMGVSALVFNHVFDFPGADPVVPLFGFVFLVALGIDYNIFLMTRVREESARRGTRAGTLQGLIRTGGVITSAGVVLAATFSALAVIPLLFLAQIAFIVAFGVLLDTIVVRSLLVPALTIDVGRRIWWPAQLSRHASSGE